MAEIINLRQARKAKKRTEAGDAAAANRAKHGQTKGEKAQVEADVIRLTRTLDGAKRETD